MDKSDFGRMVVLFGALVIVGGAAGVMMMLTIVPRIGDAIGNFFFQPSEEIEKDPHAPALAASARGDYPAAVEEYQKNLAEDPMDLLAYSEIAKISCEHLEDPAGAATTLEEALQQEWPPDDVAFLTSRLVDVYWTFQHDAARARALLVQIVEAMPGTRHAANATHRLREIEQQIAQEE
jgi:tetratricopeptide (TPR) repeat protein